MIYKIVITILLTVPYILGFKTGYTGDSGLASHLLFPFSHANIFHLACNLIAVWVLKWNMKNIIPSVAISFVASFLPGINIYPQLTMGASGIIFAAIGIMWGRYFSHEYFNTWLERDMDILSGNVKKFFLYVLVPLAVMMFLPNVNFALHLYSLYLGMLYAFFHYVITKS